MNNIKKCYDIWRPWKKYFLKPTWRFQYCWKSSPTLLRINIEELWWKWKYDEPRHEEDPSITVSFLVWNWRWTLGSSVGTDSTIYWETLLWMDKLFGKCANQAQVIYDTIANNTWTKVDNKSKETAFEDLTPLGKHLYNVWSHHVDSESRSV